MTCGPGHYIGEAEARLMEEQERAKEFTVYLAGSLSKWRIEATGKLVAVGANVGRTVRLIDPFDDDEAQEYIAGFTIHDLASISDADLVLGVVDFPQFDGIALEFGYAHALGIPIILVCKLPRVPSMMAGVAKAVFTDLDAALDYIEKRVIGGL